MITFTREQLIEHAQKHIAHDAWLKENFPDAHKTPATVDLARIALAAMQQEPVAWDYEWAACITCEGPQDFRRIIEREAPSEWAIDEGQARNIIPLYRHAQPAPAVPGDLTNTHNSVIAEQLAHVLASAVVNDHQRAIIGCAIDRLNENAALLQQVPKPVGLKDGWVVVPVEPTEDMIINGFESEPMEPPFSSSEEWEKYDAMSGCQQAAHKARLCWAAMLEAAPKYETTK